MSDVTFPNNLVRDAEDEDGHSVVDKWCPFTRFVQGTQDAGANRWMSPPEPTLDKGHFGEDQVGEENPFMTRCLGSRCMMWRAVEKDVRGYWWGFCGLAGSPRRP